MPATNNGAYINCDRLLLENDIKLLNIFKLAKSCNRLMLTTVFISVATIVLTYFFSAVQTTAQTMIQRVIDHLATGFMVIWVIAAFAISITIAMAMPAMVMLVLGKLCYALKLASLKELAITE